jgi:excisionase family DNA binding protein
MPVGKARTLLGMGERLWTEQETADYLSIHVDTLRRMRRAGTGPPSVMVGTKPRYRPSEVEAWLDRRPEERGDE